MFVRRRPTPPKKSSAPKCESSVWNFLRFDSSPKPTRKDGYVQHTTNKFESSSPRKYKPNESKAASKSGKQSPVFKRKKHVKGDDSYVSRMTQKFDGNKEDTSTVNKEGPKKSGDLSSPPIIPNNPISFNDKGGENSEYKSSTNTLLKENNRTKFDIVESFRRKVKSLIIEDVRATNDEEYLAKIISDLELIANDLDGEQNPEDIRNLQNNEKDSEGDISLKIYIDQNKFDETDEELFGKCDFTKAETVIYEAYNKDSEELIRSTVFFSQEFKEKYSTESDGVPTSPLEVNEDCKQSVEADSCNSTCKEKVSRISQYLSDNEEDWSEAKSLQHCESNVTSCDSISREEVSRISQHQSDNGEDTLDANKLQNCQSKGTTCDSISREEESRPSQYLINNEKDWLTASSQPKYETSDASCSSKIIEEGPNNDIDWSTGVVSKFVRDIIAYEETGEISATSSARSSKYSETGDEDVIPDVKTIPSPTGRVKRETYFDKNKNPVIERYTNIELGEYILRTSSPEEKAEPHQILLKKKSRLSFIIDELIQSENVYLHHLEIILKYQQIAPKIKDNHKIFGNIQTIYENSLKFYESLSKCTKSYEDIARVFVEYKNTLFNLYPIYFRQKPKVDAILNGIVYKRVIQAFQIKLNDPLDLSSYLLTPIQRLAKYIQFLEQIRKELRKEALSTQLVEEALLVVKENMRRGNDLVALDSIKDLPNKLLNNTGHFVMRDDFYILKPRKYEATLFLFEEVLIITIPDLKGETFTFKDYILINKMGIVIFEEEEFLFHIKSFLNGGRYKIFEIEALKNKVKKEWRTAIEDRLWNQLKQAKDRQQHKKSNTSLPTTKNAPNITKNVAPDIRKHKQTPSLLDTRGVTKFLSELSLFHEKTINSNTNNHQAAKSVSKIHEPPDKQGQSRFYC